MTDLWQHQIEGLEYLRSRNNGLLMHGVGVGKTLTTLAFIKERNFKFVLIVGNQKGADVWKRENEKHGFGFNIYLFNLGTLKDRSFEMLKQSKSDLPKIFVVNYEAMVRKPLSETILKLASGFDAIIFDEVHKLRNAMTKQSKFAWALQKKNPRAYRLGLTGTVIYNKSLDVFGIMRFIDPSLFGTRWQDFKFQYAVWGGQFGQIPLYYINSEELVERVKAVSHIVDRHKVLDLPDEQHIERRVRFEDTKIKQYKEFDKEFITLLEDKSKLTAINVLDKVNKLQQLTSGFFYKNGETVAFSDSKPALLRDLLEEIGEENAVVFYKYSEEARIIRDAANSLGLASYFINGQDNSYDEWINYASPSVLAVQIQSGTESIDLTKASIVIFYSLIYTYGQYEQAKGRISRANQLARTITYYYLIVENSIDEKIYKALREKKNLIDEWMGVSSVSVS